MRAPLREMRGGGGVEGKKKKKTLEREGKTKGGAKQNAQPMTEGTVGIVKQEKGQTQCGREYGEREKTGMKRGRTNRRNARMKLLDLKTKKAQRKATTEDTLERRGTIPKKWGGREGKGNQWKGIISIERTAGEKITKRTKGREAEEEAKKRGKREGKLWKRERGIVTD